jgi:replication initiation and membrane attachment protein DnaB
VVSGVEYIANQVAFINVSTIYQRIEYHRNLNVTCSTADQLYVKVEPDSITEATTIAVSTTETFDNTSQSTINDLETTMFETDWIPEVEVYFQA